MKKVAIIQARMGSSRLPGKILRELGGHSILQHVVRRITKVKDIDQIVLATTDHEEDTPLLKLAEQFGIASYAGSDQDVLDRYYQAAVLNEADLILRFTADCPFLDPRIIDEMLTFFMSDQNYDYMSAGRTFPEGYGTEIFMREALNRAWREATLLSEREHVTAYLWKNSHLFRIFRYELPEDLSWFRVTLDEEADFQVISEVYRSLSGIDPEFGLESVHRYFQKNPELAKVNSHIPFQFGYSESLKRETKIQ